MRILHVIPTLDPAAGGPPAVVTRLGAAQAGLGHQVTMFCYQNSQAKERIEKSMELLPHRKQLTLIGIEAGGRMERLFASRARPRLRSLVREYDVVHFHGVWETVLLAAASAARDAGKPYVVTPHGMLDPWSLQQRALKKKFALALAHRKMLNGAAFLHVLNAEERDLLGPLGLRAPAVILPNGVFMNEIDPLPARGGFRAKHPGLGDKPSVLFLSRIHYKKGLDYLADAFAMVVKEVPRAQLVVAGPDDGEKGAFEARVRSHGIADHVHVVGPIYGREKIQAFVDADVFCLPSRQEGFSMAITEALACSVPVVISPACHFPEVEEVHAGHTVALNAGAISQAIVRILNDADRRRDMGIAGRALVMSRFTWPAIAEQCVKAYHYYGKVEAA